jgi:hypothetical protein
VQLFGLGLVNLKYTVIPLMHCQYIVSIYNGIDKCAFVCLRSVLCSQCFLCLWIIHSRLPLRVSLTFNNIDIPHDIRVLQGKTLTNDTDTYFCVMLNIEQPALTEHCKIWKITPSPSDYSKSAIFGATDYTVRQHSLVCTHDGILIKSIILSKIKY